jgi:VWFA-related protein
MLNASRLGCLILASLLSAGVASAQQAAQQTPPPRPPTANQILLDVVVSPKSGPPVADLQQRDFTLLDNKAPQTITSFKAIPGREAPADVLIVIDAVNVDYRVLSFQRAQISKFLRAEGGHLAYPIALAVFTDKGAQIVGNFSSDGNELSATLDREDIGLRDIGRSGGFYGAGERLQLSLQAFRQLTASEARNTGRKIMLWVSPGWPLLSGARIEIDAKQQAQIFTDIVGLNTQLLRAGVTVYDVNPLGSNEALMRTSYYQEFVKGVSKPSQAAAGNLGLQVLAVQSGGLVLDHNNDVSALLQKCLSDVAPYYEISFAAGPAERPDEYHQLEVKIAKPGLNARTRQGYYAQPAPHN